MKRVKTFESYFELHIDDIGDNESLGAYFTKIVSKSSEELNVLAITAIKDKVITTCHEFGYTITNEDSEKMELEIKNHHNQFFLLNLSQIGTHKFNIFWFYHNLKN